MTMNNRMIDLETLGVGEDAHILTIGACKFDLDTFEVDTENTFYRRVTWTSQPGRRIDPETVQWWFRQSKESRDETLRHSIHLAYALKELTTWYGRGGYAWSNGSNFDLRILRHAYENTDGLREPPWHYTNEMDVRTVVRAAKGICDKPKAFSGTKHNALDDAIHQAKYICEMWKALRANSQSLPIIEDVERVEVTHAA